ncbi:RDD family protein [Bdellovibrio svalbardensis]|uniref:RDD family protein n=1 Tax=Bdellovibrio svalbardensis TaxID=2972972 RepID=A0ABT6DMR8_9BACT|nr:RDD family protein [Bdellovibrio svalbardensis]MDG0817802.1 RDD family protein [Bdellovibrio svalbardensis]
MLFPDLSAPEASHNKNQKNPKAIAFVADRFLALVLDFLIISPIVSLLLAGLMRKTKTYFLLDSQSAEGFVAGLLVFILGAALIVLIQSVFMYFWQATPGQYFMQMRVISYPHEKGRVSFSQCLVRSFCFSLSFVALAIPFLEVLSHPLRRAFHERASDTMVITLKKVSDEGPLELEERFISSWMRMSFLIFALFAVVGALKTYHSLHAGGYKTAVTASGQCKEIQDADLQGTSRLDAALALFMLNEISDECLHKEAEASLWGDPVNSQEMAYLAKYLISDKEEQEEYFKKICADGTSSACLLGTYLKENGEKQLLKDVDQKLWVTQVLLIEDKYESRNFIASLEAIEKLQKVPALRAAMEKKYVRSIWALKEGASRNSGRVPASVQSDSRAEAKSWIEEFKEKYGVQ